MWINPLTILPGKFWRSGVLLSSSTVFVYILLLFLHAKYLQTYYMSNKRNKNLLPTWDNEKVPKLYLKCIKKTSPSKKRSFPKSIWYLAPQAYWCHYYRPPSKGTTFLTWSKLENLVCLLLSWHYFWFHRTAGTKELSSSALFLQLWFCCLALAAILTMAAAEEIS